MLFNSYLMGGFECSTQRGRHNRRHDLIAATRHDEFAEADYTRLVKSGITTARDGIRWHLIEREPYRYDFSSVRNQVEAAEKTGIQIIWDIFHYGFPDDLDIFSAEFPHRFAGFAEAFAEFLAIETSGDPILCPVNEISFFSWIAGEVGGFYPHTIGRGNELKRQLVRSSVLAIEAIRAVSPNARFVQTEPAVHVTAAPERLQDAPAAADYRNSQFDALDMLAGKLAPELGGNARYLDIIGLNYYPYNQWRHLTFETVFRGEPDYRPFNEILKEFARRYQRPLFIAETGAEDELRPAWFKYICDETHLARQMKDVQIEGLCLYPIVNHPGWDDDRHCHNGLWDYADYFGEREIYQPLATEIENQFPGQTDFSKLPPAQVFSARLARV